MRKPVLALLLVCTAASASLAGPFYVGASYGNTTIEVDDPSFSFDEDDGSWKAFAGYRFLKFLGVEAAYVDFGSPEESGVTIDASGWTAFGVGVLPLGPFGLFAKAGLVAVDTEVTGLADDSSTDPAYGVGAEFSFSKIMIRAEYEMFDVDNTDDVYMLSVGAAWKF